MNPWRWTGEKLSERDPENTMANRYLRELSSKADGMNFNLRTTFCGERKYGQDPAGTLFVLGKLSTCSFRAPRISKSTFILPKWLIFRWTVSFIILCVFLNTVSSSFQSFFLFLLESVMRAMMFNLSLFSPFLKSGFYVFKASRSSRKSNIFLGERVSLICGSSDREARKLSEAREREATMLRSS